MTKYRDQTYAALADPTRREILTMLLEDDMAVTDVAEPFEMSLAAISKHLGVLTALSGELVDPSIHFGIIATGGYDPAAPVALAPCPQPIGINEIEGQTIVCGTVSVPENHDAPGEKRIDLLFTVLKSHSEVPEPDPFLYLHGGPGSGNMNGLKGLAQVFDGWRQTRDVITFDQRAAGLSTGEAACSGVINESISEAVTMTAGGETFAACIDELKNADITLQHYNTLQNARDVPMVMSTLGYETYNVLGISYGSKLTLEVMRNAPEGVRSVILDGVPPPWLPLYDTLAVPTNDSIVRLVEDCAADSICNAAYPNLGQVLTDTLDAAAEGRIVHGPSGLTFGPAVVLDMFAQRAKHRAGALSITPYMPAMIYEFARLEDDPNIETPTLDLVIDAKCVLESDLVGDLRRTAQVTNPESETLLELAISEAKRIRETDHELEITIKALRESLTRERDYTSLAGLLDQELSRASGGVLGDSALLAAFAADFAVLIGGDQTRDALVNFIEGHYEGATSDRLIALARAMSDAEIASFFNAAGRSIDTTTFEFVTTTDLWIYVCQKDIPFNSMDGYQQTTAALEYPHLSATWDSGAGLLFLAACPLFDQFARENWHDVVQSDIPTLSLGSTWDTQTSQNWAIEATRGLSNAQAFIIPEAGHGAIIYSQCARDMAESFVADPSRKFASGTCATGAKPPFYVASWVTEEEAAAPQDAAVATTSDDGEPTAETEEASLSPSFDCTAAQSSAEKLICADADLAGLDLRLNERFAAALARAQSLDAGADEAAATLRAYQRGWISGRDECWKADDLRTCVKDAYLRREGQLVAEWLLEVPTSIVSYSCNGNPANEFTAYFFDTQLPSVRLEYGDSIDTGSLVPSASGARYSASFGRSIWTKGDQASFVWTEGTEMTCVAAG